LVKFDLIEVCYQPTFAFFLSSQCLLLRPLHLFGGFRSAVPDDYVRKAGRSAFLASSLGPAPGQLRASVAEDLVRRDFFVSVKDFALSQRSYAGMLPTILDLRGSSNPIKPSILPLRRCKPPSYCFSEDPPVISAQERWLACWMTQVFVLRRGFLLPGDLLFVVPSIESQSRSGGGE
jgi:hypothetical protein